MAAPTKTTHITNLESANPALSDVHRSHGRIRYKAFQNHTLPFTASAIGDVHRLLRFNSSDVIHRIHLFTNGGGTAGAAHLGFYKANDGVEVDDDLFCSALTIAGFTDNRASASSPMLNLKYESGTFTQANLHSPVWAVVAPALTADPLEEWDLCFQISTAITVSNIIMGMEVFYTAGD